jgi:D-alanyl-D-alanine dipeptidase
MPATALLFLVVLAAGGEGDAFVDLAALDPTIRLDVRYATPANFLGTALYPEARALLRLEVARALVRAHRGLAAEGLGLVVFDAYRPWSVTKRMWELTPPAKRGFVARPERGSNHNRGCAVDVSLYTLADGREVEMPSPYDEMSPRAAAEYAGGTAESRAARDRLRRALLAEGFAVERHEWWHFNHRTCSAYPILDVPFDRLPGQSAEMR